MPQQALCVLLSETRSWHLLGGNTHTEREPVHGMRLLVPKGGGSSRSKIYAFETCGLFPTDVSFSILFLHS